MTDINLPGVDHAIVEAFDRAMDENVRYHLRSAAQYQVINQRTFSDEPELSQDDQGRLLLKACAPGEWLRADPRGAIDREVWR